MDQLEEFVTVTIAKKSRGDAIKGSTAYGGDTSVNDIIIFIQIVIRSSVI